MSNAALARADFTKEQLQVIETQFFPTGATKVEQQYCFAVAKELGLNPILKEIHFVPRRSKVGDRWVNKVEPMVGRDGFLAVAHRSGQLAGIETAATIRDVPTLENGRWVNKPQLVATCTVWRKDCNQQFTAEVVYNEYCQRTQDGQPTRFWADKPETMLKKVAESQALRKAFNIHGVYSPEELGSGYETDAGEIVRDMDDVGVVPGRGRLALVGNADHEAHDQRQAEHSSVDNVSSSSQGLQTTSQESLGDELDNILALLESRDIPYEIDQEIGLVSARSYDERQLLKASGFRWNAADKSWQYTFDPVPF